MLVLKGITIILLLIGIIFAPLFGLYYLIRYITGFWNKNSLRSRIDIKYAELVLSSKFAYYQKLDDKDRSKFLKRLMNFIEYKEFKGSGGAQLTEEMIVLISASAIQLTFGLSEYRLDHFSKIFVYPKAYYSKISKQYHKGETNLAGAIAISWHHFIEGYTKPNDKVNLGLHEMAHALRFDKFKNDDYDRFFNSYYNKWHAIANPEFRKAQEGKEGFFREYGGTNINEFFAVCVESFFESPSEFRKLHPDIYKHMCILLNQDPLSGVFSSEIRNTDEYIALQGDPYYSSGMNTTGILSLIFVSVIWFSFVMNSGMNLDSILLSVIMLSVGYLITVRSFSKAHFYEEGISIRSVIPDLINNEKELNYDNIICVEFMKRFSDETNDNIRITYLNNGKIKAREFSDSFAENEVLRFADILVSKKVAVRMKGFSR